MASSTPYDAAFMSLGHSQRLGHHVYPYRASTDRCGLEGIYVVVGARLWLAVCLMHLVVPVVLQTSVGIKPDDYPVHAGSRSRPHHCRGRVACIATVEPPGSSACDGSGPPACDTLVMNAEGVFYLLWGWSWALVGTRIFTLLRAARHDLPSIGKSDLHFFWFKMSVSDSTKFLLLHIGNLSPARAAHIRPLPHSIRLLLLCVTWLEGDRCLQPQ